MKRPAHPLPSTALGCVTLLGVLAVTHCGGPSAAPSAVGPGHADGGTADVLATADVPPDAMVGATDASASDTLMSTDVAAANVPPMGAPLVPGLSLTIQGVTTDGYVVYLDGVHGSVNAVSIHGGTPQTIATSLGSTFDVVPTGKAVLVWTGEDSAAETGALIVWTAATGAHPIAATSQPLQAAIDASGTWVVYTTNVRAGDSVTNLCDLGASRLDGTMSTVLLEGIATSEFIVGGLLMMAGNYAVVNYTTTQAAWEISSFELGSWTRADLAEDPVALALADAESAHVLFTGSAANLQAVPITGGNAIVVSPDSTSGLLTSDGMNALYAGMSGATLDRSPIASPADQVLGYGTNLSLLALAPDESSVLVTGGVGASGSGQATPGGGDGADMQDVFVHSATSGNPAGLTAVGSTTNLGLVGYTNDSSYVVALNQLGDTAWGTGGTLLVIPVTGTTTRTVEVGVLGWAASGSTKVVYDRSSVTADGGASSDHADLKVVDLATSDPPRVIVTNGDSAWVVSPGGDTVVYSSSAQSGSAGIYVAPVP